MPYIIYTCIYTSLTNNLSSSKENSSLVNVGLLSFEYELKFLERILSTNQNWGIKHSSFLFGLP